MHLPRILFFNTIARNSLHSMSRLFKYSWYKLTIYPWNKALFVVKLFKNIFLTIKKPEKPVIFLNIQDYRLSNNFMYLKYKNYASAFAQYHQGIVIAIDFSSTFQLRLIHLFLNKKLFPIFNVNTIKTNLKFLPFNGLLRSSWDISIRKPGKLSASIYKGDDRSLLELEGNRNGC